MLDRSRSSGNDLRVRGLAEGRLRAVAERARAAWPEFTVDLEPFIQHLTHCVSDEPAPTEALERMAVDDLYLAYACGTANRAALRRFADECDHEFQAVATRLRISASQRDDARQRLWQKLFVGEDGALPRILDYRGRGRLRAWFRVLAARAVLDGMRQDKRLRGEKPLPDDPVFGSAMDVDPEILHLKRLYRTEFRVAFEQSMSALGAEERNALRSCYVLGMTVDQMAAAFGVHRATAARRVARAREALLVGTRERLQARLQVSSGELDSVMRLVDSQLSASVSRLLEP